MSITVRPFEERDRQGNFEVRSLTYNNGDPIPPDRQAFKWTRPFVAEHDGQVKGICGVLDLTCTRGEALLKCGGVAGVAVLPHERRLGVGKAMMSWLVRRLREEGTPLASLYAFRESYYRKFGYEVCGKRLKISCPTHRLPKIDNPLPVRKLTPDQWQDIDPCFNTFAHARSGVSRRDDRLWHRVLAENRPLTIYAAGDPVEGFVVVSHSVEFWSSDHMSDVAWSTIRGHEVVMDILSSIGINKTAFSWYEPSDSPFVARYMDQGIEVSVDRPIMFRVCDVPAALSALKTKTQGSFSLGVVDDLVPENWGPWQVDFDEAGVEVRPATQADLVIDIRQFAGAFLGEPSWQELARNGLVEVRNPEALEAAVKLMPPSPVYCPEFF